MLVGVAIWGAATGIQDSTVKALVAGIVPGERRGSAYGWFSVFQGAGAFLGGTVADALYGQTTTLVVIVGILQAVAFGLLLVLLRRRPRKATRTS